MNFDLIVTCQQKSFIIFASSASSSKLLVLFVMSSQMKTRPSQIRASLNFLVRVFHVQKDTFTSGKGVMKNLLLRLISSLFLCVHLVSINSFGYEVGSHIYEYNPGPDVNTQMGKLLVDIFAEQPFYGLFSQELMDEQKFRYIFGLMMTRARFEKNATKIFFIGQDATHIAEASKQPGTSGFGGRVQDIAHFFGVDQGVATSNAFLSTIKGQFGAFNHPVVELDDSGMLQFKTGKYIDNELWMIANDPDSEIRIERERFWEWMIVNNPDSLKMMALFGDAAKHAFAQFLIARGFDVPTVTTDEQLKRKRIPETVLKNAGGNAEFAVPVNKEGDDIYQILENEKAKKENREPITLNYSQTDDSFNGREKQKQELIKKGEPVDHQKYAMSLVKEAGQSALNRMIFTDGGIQKSGMMNAAQLGGYDFSKIKNPKGQVTNSLKGLKTIYIKPGYEVKNDLAFVESPHPTVLSQMTKDKAIATLKKAFEPLKKVKDMGWFIEPDIGIDGKPLVNSWHNGVDPDYGRADIRQGFFEFGAAESRRASKSDAIRLNPQTIIIGSRQKVDFNRQILTNMENAQPSDLPNPDDLWSVRPRNKEQRYDFDSGPGLDVAKPIMTALYDSKDKIFALKPGIERKLDSRGNDVTFDTYGINAYYTKTVPEDGFFGIHRGDFKTAKVLILADPHGLDDWNTARALTGARGQYLNGLMNDAGYGRDYLVIKTAPFGMDNATAEDWEYVRKSTETYREAALKEALKNKNIEFVMADGPIAQSEIQRILKKLKRNDLNVVMINRDGLDPKSGLEEAAQSLQKLGGKFANAPFSLKMKDIPRGHLPWWSRTWEGTSGDLVLDASGQSSGKVRALLTPDWVVKQKIIPTEDERVSIEKLRNKMIEAGLKVGSETFQSFFDRIERLKERSSKIVSRLDKTKNQCFKFYKRVN